MGEVRLAHIAYAKYEITNIAFCHIASSDTSESAIRLREKILKIARENAECGRVVIPPLPC